MTIVFNGQPLADSAIALSLPALDESLGSISEDSRAFFFGFTTCAGRVRREKSSKIVQHCHELEGALRDLGYPIYHDLTVTELLLSLRQIRELCASNEISSWTGITSDDLSGTATREALERLDEDAYKSAPVVVVDRLTPDSESPE